MATEDAIKSMSKKWEVPEGYYQTGPCPRCIHKHLGTATCDAFPTKIPLEIRDGSNQHTSPVPGDNGIIFEEIITN